jgi:predicted ABC-type ATPase
MGQPKPVFSLLAGPNGAGKSTPYQALVLVLAGTIAAIAEFVNADLYEGEQLQHLDQPHTRSEQARLWARCPP